MAQANISFFIVLGFIYFGRVETAVPFLNYNPDRKQNCIYNNPNGVVEKIKIDVAEHMWEACWHAIQSANSNFQGSEWILVSLIKQFGRDRGKVMRAPNLNDPIDWDWRPDAYVLAEWQKPDLNIEISGTLEITTVTDSSLFEPAGGLRFVKQVILKMFSIDGLNPSDMKVEVLTTGTIKVVYTIMCFHQTKWEADRIADRVSRFRDLTTVSFKTAARNCLEHNWLNSLQDGLNDIVEYWRKVGVDDIDVVETKIAPTMTRHAVDVATINLQLGGITVIDGTGGFAAQVNIRRDWAGTKEVILKQLGNSISQQTHNILYSTVSLGGAEHDDKTNLSDKDIIYVSATQKTATINLQLGGKPVIGYAAKVDIKSRTDGSDSVQGAKEVTKKGFSKLEIAMVILCFLVFIVVTSIALWFRIQQYCERQKYVEIQLRKGQGTW